MKTTTNTLLVAISKFFPRGAFMTTVLMFCLANIRAQDIILLRDGSEIKAKILQITEHEIEYNNYNQNRIARSIYKSDVFMIRYENGTREVFEPASSYSPTLRQPPQPKYSEAIPEKFDPDSSDFARMRRKKFDGPRVGFTSLGPGTSAGYMTANNKRPFVTQFGWQFEGRLFTVEETSGIVEFVPMVGGLEQGMFIPSLSTLIGVRGGNSIVYEFAIGPNISVASDYVGQREAFFGVVLAAGTSLKKGNVYFPITLAFVPSVGHVKEIHDAVTNTTSRVSYHTGNRISILIGFNTRKR